ncbi:MAG TPA: FtsX-like permease family protein [Puia sp.]|nr:FtsX-like permease family protein [Puia sp.]
MFRNYFKIAIRNLTRRKGYALLNIFGLAIGIICCLLIFQYVSYERSFDRFNRQAKDIVRLRLDSYQQGELAWKSATIYPAIGPAMKNEFPEVENFCRLHDAEMLLSNPEKDIKFSEKKGYYADPSSIEMLGLDMPRGGSQRMLDAPGKMIVSNSFAKKYFGSDDVVGKTLVSTDQRFIESYLITGVFRDYPSNSHLIIDYLVSYSSLGKRIQVEGDTSNATETSWGWYDFYTYLKLRPGADRQKLESKFSAFCDLHMNNTEWNRANNVKVGLHLLPITDIYLYSNYNQEAEINGDGQTVSFLFLISIVIILIAWINYINLATARSIERAKEVGVRKVLGAFRLDLIRQFLTESFMLNFIALLAAIAITSIVAPAFNNFLGRSVYTGFSLPPIFWIGFLLMFLAGSLLSGIYPAFVLSGYEPVTVLKGLFKNTSRGVLLRKALITIQFVASVILVAGTLVVYQQLSFMRHQKLGMNINQTLVINGSVAVRDSAYQSVYQPFRQELLRYPNIHNVTASTSVMGNEIYWTSGIRRLAANSKDVTLYHLAVDYDFISSFGIELKAGRTFSRKYTSDLNHAVMLNEEAVKLLGFKSDTDAVNQKVIRHDTLTVVGVIANYHHEGLQKRVQPMIILLMENPRDYYSIKLGSNNINESLAFVQKTWKKYFASDPFTYFFLDDEFNKQYKSDEMFGSTFTLFSVLAILIACFGLFGLSSYNVLQRRKEIGVRKVLGASIPQLLYLLSKDFLRLVTIAFLFAVPLTWILMNRWLDDFAYRISIGWQVFTIAGLIAVVIAFTTVSLQAVRAAVANPVICLRTE